MGDVVPIPRKAVADQPFKGVASGHLEPAARQRCIFDEDWWLDAACPGAWDRVEARWDGILVGDMAFHLRRRRLFSYITMPHLTRTQSPRLMPQQDKPALQRIHNLAILRELVDKLPRHDRFERALDIDCDSLQGFVHAGFTATHMFTMRSPPGMTPESMTLAAHQKTRRIIRRAQRECSVERSVDLDRFIRLHNHSYGEQGTIDHAILGRLFSAAQARGQAEIVFVRYGDAADTAAIILVWDHEAVYYWVIARDREQNYIGANSILIYEAMCTAHRLGRVLDLDSYVKPEVGAFLMKFGLDLAVRPVVNRSTQLWRSYDFARGLFTPATHERTFRVA